ncbi:CvpA family protein [Buchnera aphidicola]|uniref:CvpA family protein n=1 Tax=Buchnera aphidicola TaxID=9 RepID=UPI003D18EC2E
MNIYDYFIIFIIFISSIIGFRKGFIKEMFSILIFFIGFCLFYFFYFYILNLLNFIDNYILKLIFIFFIFSFSILLFEFIFYYLCNDFLKFIKKFYLSNFILGFIFGFLRGILLIFLIIYIFKNFLHINNYFYLKNSIFSPFCLKFIYFFSIFNKNKIL